MRIVELCLAERQAISSNASLLMTFHRALSSSYPANSEAAVQAGRELFAQDVSKTVHQGLSSFSSRVSARPPGRMSGRSGDLPAPSREPHRGRTAIVEISGAPHVTRSTNIWGQAMRTFSIVARTPFFVEAHSFMCATAEEKYGRSNCSLWAMCPMILQPGPGNHLLVGRHTMSIAENPPCAGEAPSAELVEFLNPMKFQKQRKLFEHPRFEAVIWGLGTSRNLCGRLGGDVAPHPAPRWTPCYEGLGEGTP